MYKKIFTAAVCSAVLFAAGCKKADEPVQETEQAPVEEETVEEEYKEVADVSILRNQVRDAGAIGGVIYLGDSSGMAPVTFLDMSEETVDYPVLKELPENSFVYGSGNNYYAVLPADSAQRVSFRMIGESDAFYTHENSGMVIITVENDTVEAIVGNDTFTLTPSTEDYTTAYGATVLNLTKHAAENPGGREKELEELLLKEDAELAKDVEEGTYKIDWSRTGLTYVGTDEIRCFNIVAVPVENEDGSKEERAYAVTQVGIDIYKFDNEQNKWVPFVVG